MKKDQALFIFIIILAFANFKFSQYFYFWAWSEFAHFSGGVLLSLLIKLRWQRIDSVFFQKSRFLTRCFIISACAIWWLAFWELFEYARFSFNILSVEIYHDTMRDLMMDFLGTFIATPFLSRG